MITITIVHTDLGTDHLIFTGSEMMDTVVFLKTHPPPPPAENINIRQLDLSQQQFIDSYQTRRYAFFLDFLQKRQTLSYLPTNPYGTKILLRQVCTIYQYNCAKNGKGLKIGTKEADTI